MMHAMKEENFIEILEIWEKKCQFDYKTNINFHGYALLIEILWAHLKKEPEENDFKPGGKYYRR